jgi:flagellar biogenesis protein FliO
MSKAEATTMTRRTAQFLAQRQGSILKFLLSLIVVLFICIIFTVYLVARHANPIFLDEHGKPVNAQTAERPAKSY